MISRYFKTAKIKITKDQLFDNFIYELCFSFFESFERPKYLIIFQAVEYWFFKW